MMIRFRKCIIPMLISTAVVLSGCSTDKDPNNLLQSPVPANEKQEEVKEALEKLLPVGVEYLAPEKEEPNQYIFVEDFNKDGKEDAFVLYRQKEENQEVHIVVLRNEDGKWNKVQDESTNSKILDYMKIEDLDGDGLKEVVVGIVSAKLEHKKELMIYEWDKKGLSKKLSQIHEGVDVGDYNEDGKVDILLLEGELNKFQGAQLFNYAKGELQSISKVQLDPYAYHENIVRGKLADGKKALFIDSGIGAHSMLTEIIAYDSGKLIKIGDVKDRFLFKAYPEYSKDINKDGVTEAAGMYIPRGWEDASFAEIPFIYAYAGYHIDGTRQTIEERYINGKKNFYITLPPSLYGKATIEKLEQGIRILSNADKKVLFEVKWISKELFDDSKIKLKETKDIVFYTDIKEKTVISGENFHLIEEDF